MDFKLLLSKFKAGFTLVELLVVIGLLGILATVSLGSYLGTQRNARDSRRKSDLEQLRQAIELFRAYNGSYPVAGTGSWAPITSLTRLTSEGYLSAFPTDPKVGGVAPYVYRYQATNPVGSPVKYYGYCIEATLESSTPVSNPCPPESGFNYTVKNP